MKTELIEAEDKPLAIVKTDDPVLRMMDKVIEGDHEIETLKELMTLRREEIDRQALVAFDNSLAEAQSEMPVIAKRGRGRNNDYALWEDLNEKIKPVLTKHGFSLSFTSDISDDRVTVTATLRKGGHSITGSFDAPIESPKNKSGTNVMNGSQARGSAMSYGKRYATIGLLNISAVGEDDDAYSTQTSFDTTPWTERILEAKDMEELREIGADLKGAEMPNGSRVVLQSAWAGRAKDLSNG